MSVTKISNHKCTESECTAASWNVTSSCLFSSLPYHVVNCAYVLHHFKQEITSQLFPHLKISLSLHTLLELLLNIKGWHDPGLNSIPTHCVISVNSLAQGYVIRVWLGSCDVHKNAFLHLSTPNFETSSHQNVTANKWIGNMYFMYVVMAWFKSL